MKKLASVLVFLLVLVNAGLAYTSGFAIQTSDKSQLVQVYINGKLYNKKPTNFIRIKSTQGTFHLKVKILNLQEHTWQEVVQYLHPVAVLQRS